MHLRAFLGFFISLGFVFVAATCLPIHSGAQTSTGEMSITVLDATGAVVPNAAVTVTGSQTGNILRSLSSNDRGIVNAPLIPPGDYNISVTAPGFKSTVRRSVPVSVSSV